MIDTEWNGRPDSVAIDLVLSRMRWEPVDSETRLRIVTQNNLDCIFEIEGDLESDDESQRYLRLASVVKIDNLHTDMYSVDSPHYFHQPYSLGVGQVVERLIRMNQNYKIQMQHAINMNTFGNDQ